MQGGHSVLSYGISLRKGCLRFGNGVIVQMRNQPVGGLPGFGVRFSHDDVQANAEAHFAPMRGGFGAHLLNFLFHQLRRFAPGQIEINLFSSQILRDI
ncbi:hypothetical protein D3C81_1947250 [compost metagenome]